MKDIVTSYIAYFALTIANLLVGVLAARLLLPAGRGELGQVILWPTLIAALGAFSIPDAMIYFMAHRRESARDVVASAFALAGMLALVLCGVALAITPHIYGKMGPEVRFAAYLYILYIPTGYIGTYIVAMFQGRLMFDQWNLLRTLVSVSYAVYALAIWLLFGASVLGFAVASLLASATVAAVGSIMLARRGWLGLRPHRRLMTGMLGFGGRLHIAELLGLANQRIDQILITRWLTSHEYGYYLVALSVWGSSVGIVLLLGQLMFPKVASETRIENKAEALGRYMRLALSLAVIGTVLLVVLAPWLVVLAFGAAFRPAVPVLQILSIGIAPVAGKALLIQAFKAFGRPRTIILAECLALAVNVVGLSVMIPRYGIHGAAAVLIASQTVGCIALALLLRHQIGISLRSILVPTQGDVRFVVGRLREMLGRRAAL